MAAKANKTSGSGVPVDFPGRLAPVDVSWSFDIAVLKLKHTTSGFGRQSDGKLRFLGGVQIATVLGKSQAGALFCYRRVGWRSHGTGAFAVAARQLARFVRHLFVIIQRQSATSLSI
ncbi:hypothetical protein DB346_04715 [Verrucomicrobia bacterium LW23]|nr:hypothetical protein DB346_04715 [Verrucomicrobia bacterium LW23]